MGLVSASWMIGTDDALYDTTSGGVDPGGVVFSTVCEMAVICATAISGLTVGWKKNFTTATPFSDWDSICSMSLTVVVAARS